MPRPADAIPELREEDLWEVAKTVYDPELPVNIVDLGLIYRLEIKKDSDGKNNVEADMTLTAPGCAMAPCCRRPALAHGSPPRCRQGFREHRLGSSVEPGHDERRGAYDFRLGMKNAESYC